jgi:hypothetical protein
MKLFSHLGICELAEMADCNNQQFIDVSRLVKLYGEQDVAKEWVWADPWEFEGKFTYYPAGTLTDPAANKEVRKRTLIELYAVVKDDPYVKRDKVLRDLFENADLPVPQEYVMTAAEIEQENQKQLAQQQAQMQQQQQVQQGQQSMDMLKMIFDLVAKFSNQKPSEESEEGGGKGGIPG